MNLRRLNPFAGLAHPRSVWAWAMFDLANQSFTLIVNTMLFAIFFKDVVVRDPERDDFLWSSMVAVSMLLVVIASPIAGAIADEKGWKKPLLLAAGASCGLLTCALGLIPPGGLLVAALLYIPANFSFALAENFLASFIPEVATRREVGRVSGIGWTLGYVGAVVLLIATAGAMAVFGLEDPSRWRPLLVFAGVWFLVMATPTALLLPRDRAGGDGTVHLVRAAFGRLASTARSASKRRDLMLALLAFMSFGIGVQVVIFFAGVLARDFGFDGPWLALFLLQLTVTAGIGSVIPMAVQDRVGHRRTVLLFLGLWIAVSGAMTALVASGTETRWPLWVIGNGVGLALGGIGTSTRALIGYMTPAHKAAEFFGLWGLVYKVAGVGVFTFGYAKDRFGEAEALGVLTGFFVIGAAILLLVDADRGAALADREEREHAGEVEEEDVVAGAAFGKGPIAE